MTLPLIQLFDKNMSRRYKLIGSIGKLKSLEAPIGINGIHGHFHVLISHTAGVDMSTFETVARREWESKEFLNRVIISLNIFSDGTLKIRTVLERSIEEVFLNPIAIEKIQAAVKLCTPDSPIGSPAGSVSSSSSRAGSSGP